MSADSLRIDRWLFATRLFKSRTLAAQAAAGGKVHVNGSRVKASHPVRAGDRVSFVRGATTFDCAVLSIPLRRGPAKDARQCYEETEGSRAERERFAERMRTAAVLSPRPLSRPEKHERRELRRIRGRD
jgi:ribosome-associated heat shock protein Hsp15